MDFTQLIADFAERHSIANLVAEDNAAALDVDGFVQVYGSQIPGRRDRCNLSPRGVYTGQKTVSKPQTKETRQWQYNST